MTNKERTIKACKDLIVKYRSPLGRVFFQYDECPLCDIHHISDRKCKGCPLANKEGWMGCIDFKSFDRAAAVMDIMISTIIYDGRKLTGALKRYETRAKFFEKIIPILEAMPNKRFTREGWKFTEEILRKW